MAVEQKPRVLIVDDEAVIVRLLQVNFRIEGFDVDSASRGDEAVQAARARKPDVIILDVMMPGMDGWQVCGELKADPELADIPVIFLSARTDDEERRRGYALGVVEYVTKPFDPARLVALVRRTLAGAGSD